MGAHIVLRVQVRIRSSVQAAARTVSRGDHGVVCLQVLKRVPGLKKLDGIPIDVDEREAAKAA